jgi:hypothetical protein
MTIALLSLLQPSILSTSSMSDDDTVVDDAIKAAKWPQMQSGKLICDVQQYSTGDPRSLCWIANNGTLLCDNPHYFDYEALNAVGAHFVAITCGSGVCALDSQISILTVVGNDTEHVHAT